MLAGAARVSGKEAAGPSGWLKLAAAVVVGSFAGIGGETAGLLFWVLPGVYWLDQLASSRRHVAFQPIRVAIDLSSLAGAEPPANPILGPRRTLSDKKHSPSFCCIRNESTILYRCRH
ncbi:hypothetical protein WJX84_004419 [Apatococcus fuscideae]|uniref:Uncharacterized protein n=1 Tax=Apatococcus fuscideae TaxID=2026836 RepID=A0AAW1SNH3_9CHLO